MKSSGIQGKTEAGLFFERDRQKNLITHRECFEKKAIHLLSLTLNIKDQKENFKNIYIFNQHKNGCNIRKINYKRIFMKKQYQIIIKDLKHPRKD